jgi:hypothetical protein
MGVAKNEVTFQEAVLKEADLGRERAAIAVKNSLNKYSGKIKKKGDTVRILGLIEPEVSDYDGSDLSFKDAHLTDDKLVVDQSKYVGTYIPDADTEQSEFDVVREIANKGGKAIAQVQDKFVFEQLATGVGSSQIIDATNTGSATVLSLMTSMATKLYESDVPADEELILEVSPAMFGKITLAQIIYKTDNTDLFKQGYMGQYGKMKIYLSNNLHKDSGADCCILRTKKAYAFAQTIQKMEIVKTENNFGKKVKGLSLYGGRIIRPAEIVVAKFTGKAETAI